MFEQFKSFICLDFKIYDCIMFQLISNAIKHCFYESAIKICFSFKPREETDQTDPIFSGTLTTTITNEGSSRAIREKFSFKTFNSSLIDSSKDESGIKTVGLGLSIADALTCHLGGKFQIKDVKD